MSIIQIIPENVVVLLKFRKIDSYFDTISRFDRQSLFESKFRDELEEKFEGFPKSSFVFQIR